MIAEGMAVESSAATIHQPSATSGRRTDSDVGAIGARPGSRGHVWFGGRFTSACDLLPIASSGTATRTSQVVPATTSADTDITALPATVSSDPRDKDQLKCSVPCGRLTPAASEATDWQHVVPRPRGAGISPQALALDASAVAITRVIQAVLCRHELSEVAVVGWTACQRTLADGAASPVAERVPFTGESTKTKRGRKDDTTVGGPYSR